MKESNNSERRKWYKWSLTWLIFIGLLIKIISINPGWIEYNYSEGIYPWIASFLRVLLGWLPFSVGDIIYFVAGVVLLWQLGWFIKMLVKRRLTWSNVKPGFYRIVKVVLLIYILFNIAWGLNYNRLGIAYQLKLNPKEYSKEDLQVITKILVQKVNESRKPFSDPIIPIPPYPQLFNNSRTAYDQALAGYPFLRYEHESIKRSFYGRLGNSLGFLGYYNPFSGEAQLNLTMPSFLVPFVTCHEMAHQLGYASESEANFVGYLAAKNSVDTLFHYSAYFDLFSYANKELFFRDSASALDNYSHLDKLVKGDYTQLRSYMEKAKNPFEPIIRTFYDGYLKANQQEKGVQSYNEVVGWLIAFKKKYGFI